VREEKECGVKEQGKNREGIMSRPLDGGTKHEWGIPEQTQGNGLNFENWRDARGMRREISPPEGSCQHRAGMSMSEKKGKRGS